MHFAGSGIKYYESILESCSHISKVDNVQTMLCWFFMAVSILYNSDCFSPFVVIIPSRIALSQAEDSVWTSVWFFYYYGNLGHKWNYFVKMKFK